MKRIFLCGIIELIIIMLYENYIFNKNNSGFIGKADLSDDLFDQINFIVNNFLR